MDTWLPIKRPTKYYFNDFWYFIRIVLAHVHVFRSYLIMLLNLDIAILKHAHINPNDIIFDLKTHQDPFENLLVLFIYIYI